VPTFFCSISVKYKPISIKIGLHVLEEIVIRVVSYITFTLQYMREMSASSAYQDFICRRTEITHQEGVNTMFIERSATIYVLTFVLEADILST